MGDVRMTCRVFVILSSETNPRNLLKTTTNDTPRMGVLLRAYALPLIAPQMFWLESERVAHGTGAEGGGKVLCDDPRPCPSFSLSLTVGSLGNRRGEGGRGRMGGKEGGEWQMRGAKEREGGGVRGEGGRQDKGRERNERGGGN